MDVPAIRYTRTTDGLNIAYQVVGEGPFDLVFVPQVISNVQIFWENPRWADFMRELASFSRLLLFDRRGVGLSDRPSGVPALEQRMDDVRAVMDVVGSERAALFGTGPDGAMAVLFAATYPERVTALVLFAVPPRGREPVRCGAGPGSALPRARRHRPHSLGRRPRCRRRRRPRVRRADLARQALGGNRTRPRPRHGSLHRHRRIDGEGNDARQC